MSRTFRRFEILLPLRFNDGQPVPEELVADTLLELRVQFGAVSCETQIIRVIWQQADHTFRDDLIRVFVDVPADLESRQFFIQFKERTRIRFKRIDIWMTTYLVEVIYASSLRLDDLPDRFGPFDADESLIESTVKIGELVGVETELGQESGMEIFDVKAVGDGGGA